MNNYFINRHEQDGWNGIYKHFHCDADAMVYARSLLGATCNCVSIYRHLSDDSCSTKTFVAAYDR